MWTRAKKIAIQIAIIFIVRTHLYLSGLPTYRYNTADAGRNVIWRIAGGCDGKNAVHG